MTYIEEFPIRTGAMSDRALITEATQIEQAHDVTALTGNVATRYRFIKTEIRDRGL